MGIFFFFFSFRQWLNSSISVAVFLFCGLVSKNHMLLNLPGILIPQNANHLLPGRVCVNWELESDSKLRGLQRGLLGLRTFAYPSCLSPITPYSPTTSCQTKSLSWINKLLVLIRDLVERAEETGPCSQLTLPLFYITQTVFLVPSYRWTSFERIYCIPSF